MEGSPTQNSDQTPHLVVLLMYDQRCERALVYVWLLSGLTAGHARHGGLRQVSRCEIDREVHGVMRIMRISIDGIGSKPMYLPRERWLSDQTPIKPLISFCQHPSD